MTDELLKLLLSRSVKLILIKGAPGTGKTSLATRLLDFVESGVYISTRVGLDKLPEQNPRLRALEAGGMFDAVNTTSARVNYEDVRLGTPGRVVEEVIKATSAGKELIILDSWDTLAKEMERTDRLKTEKTIAALIDTSQSRGVFVGEESNLTTTDYLVDAIVTLVDAEIAGRRLREIVWNKLRGQGIINKRSSFTLSEGRFTLMDSPKLEQSNREMFKPISNIGWHYSTGSRDLDQFFGGGLKKGLFIFLEIGPTVGNDWHRPIFESMRYNFLSNGGACITVSSPSVTPEMVLEAAILNVGEEIVRSRLRIMSYTPSTGHPSIVDIRGGSLEESLKIQENVAAEVKKNNLPVLWIMSIDTYETFAFKDKALIANYIAQGTAILRQSGDVTLVFGKPSTSSVQLLSDNCDIHLRLEEVNGALILYAVRPPTSAFGVTYEFASGYPQVHLTRIM